MKAMISVATNIFADVVYFMIFSGQKGPGAGPGKRDNGAVLSHPIASS
ncbi:TPA: hypothetical protein JAW44_002504 [Citrobacter werkmanii]|uniref:Uncharacterized protein n=1 Tax=Citrobacter werkmanii TaxID=67827 RepID=A0AA37Z9R7_9ENTR|nr:hypothetical protein [Citrobacter werkmanii]